MGSRKGSAALLGGCTGWVVAYTVVSTISAPAHKPVLLITDIHYDLCESRFPSTQYATYVIYAVEKSPKQAYTPWKPFSSKVSFCKKKHLVRKTLSLCAGVCSFGYSGVLCSISFKVHSRWFHTEGFTHFSAIWCLQSFSSHTKHNRGSYWMELVEENKDCLIANQMVINCICWMFWWVCTLMACKDKLQ